MSFLPIARPTILTKPDGFRICGEHLPELRGQINYDRKAKRHWKVFRDGGLAPCGSDTPNARLFFRIEIEVDRYGLKTIDVPPGSHRNLRWFVARNRGKRVWITIKASGEYVTILFNADDGKPMAEPIPYF